MSKNKIALLLILALVAILYVAWAIYENQGVDFDPWTGVTVAYAQEDGLRPTPTPYIPTPTPAPTMDPTNDPPLPTPGPLPTEQKFYLPAVYKAAYEVDWFMAPTYWLCWGDFQWITLYEEPVILETWYRSDCPECPKTIMYVFEYEGTTWWGNTEGVNEGD